MSRLTSAKRYWSHSRPSKFMIPVLSQVEKSILDLLGDRGLSGGELLRLSGGSLRGGTLYVICGRMERKGYLTSSFNPRTRRRTFEVRGPGFSDRYEGEPAAVVIARRAYSLGLSPLRAR
jgi:hypothetical protein